MYKKLSLILALLNVVFLIILGLSIDPNYDLTVFDFVAFDFTTELKAFSRISLAIEELLDLHFLNSVQYNTLPVCMTWNALASVIAFTLNIKRWHNFLTITVQLYMLTFLIQLTYVFMLNSSSDIMLLLISGCVFGVCILLYALVTVTCLCVKMVNPIRRGGIVLIIGLLAYYKSYLHLAYEDGLVGQVFTIIAMLIAMELLVDFLNVMEKIIKNDKSNNRLSTRKIHTGEN